MLNYIKKDFSSGNSLFMFNVFMKNEYLSFNKFYEESISNVYDKIQ